MIRLNDHYQQKLEKTNSRPALSTAGAPPRLDPDLLTGLRRAVTNGQNRLALEYVFAVIDAQAAQITELQNHITASQPEDPNAPSEPDMPAGPIPKPNPTKEAEPVEERKKQRSAPSRRQDDASDEENV